MAEEISKWDLSYTSNRELSWLKFNERVLDQAADSGNPLLERLRFLSIFSSNLDEFFRVRVGSLADLSIMTPDETENKSGMTPRQQMKKVYAAVHPLFKKQDAVWAELNAQLLPKGLGDLSPDNLSEGSRQEIRSFLQGSVRPLLSPQIIDRNHPFPFLQSGALYIAALLRSSGKKKLGIVPVPTGVSRLFRISDHGGNYIRLETILLDELQRIFSVYTVEQSAVILVARNADIRWDAEKFDDDVGPDFRAQMEELLKKRERLAPVHLTMSIEAPELQEELLKRLGLTPAACDVSSAPLTMGWAYDLQDEAYLYPKYTPVYPDWLQKDVPMWDQVMQRDILLFYPYHSMQPFIQLLRESARDPEVVSIQMTIYRLARNSQIVSCLEEAADAGKQVNVVIELRARFDEQDNIDWSSELEAAGCRVVYGPEGYKCHAKVCLITKKTKAGLHYVTQIGTGNYNEKTAAQYTDFCLMTARKDISRDAVAFFQNMLIENVWGEYRSMLIAPVTMKQAIIHLIDGEMARGSAGRIILKTNSVTERDLIDRLSAASCAGVKIDLIVRGICCLVPGVPGKTENIRVTSIVGRFLEHSRIYCFGEGPLRVIYLSSADIMTRNQQRRVEAACPVASEEHIQFLSDYLDLLLRDNVKARVLQPDGQYLPAHAGEHVPSVNAQEYYIRHPIEMQATVRAKKGLFARLFAAFRRKKV